MLFLFETRSTGEAAERFKLLVSANPLVILGAAIPMLAVTALAVLYLSLGAEKTYRTLGA
jgi:hypothetical protein